MRIYSLLFLAASLLMLVNCFGQKKSAFDFPASMNDADRQKFTEICTKGEILYQINCSSCHNVKVKRKAVIPDFTQDQMSRYDLKANNMQHDSSGVFVRIPPADLSKIYLFLTYKKKSNVPLVLPDHG